MCRAPCGGSVAFGDAGGLTDDVAVDCADHQQSSPGRTVTDSHVTISSPVDNDISLAQGKGFFVDLTGLWRARVQDDTVDGATAGAQPELLDFGAILEIEANRAAENHQRTAGVVVHKNQLPAAWVSFDATRFIVVRVQ